MEIFLDLLKTKFAWMSLWYQIVRVKKKFQCFFYQEFHSFTQTWCFDGQYWAYCHYLPVAIYCGFSEIVFLYGSEYYVSKVP